MIVLSSPSGGGKTTIARMLMKRDRNIVRSISCTTRKPRAGERNGRDYFFITPTRFKRMVERGDFLEWAKVHRHCYGTPRRWVGLQLSRGKDVLLIIDVQGGNAVKLQNQEALLIFLSPPSLSVLRERLLGRHSEDTASLKERLKNAKREIREGNRYDYQVINDQLAKAAAKVAAIITRKRKRASKKPSNTAESVKIPFIPLKSRLY